MALDQINNDLHVNGTLSAKTANLPDGCIGDDEIQSNAGIAASKIVHQFDLNYTQVPGTAVVAATHDLRIVKGATAVVAAIEAAITGTIATGADRTVNVDLQKGNAGSAFATILTGTIEFDNADALRTPTAGAIASPNLVDGDILRVVITVAGAAGNQADGLIVSVTLQEDPQ